ncbi:MAG: DUF933 domain-containing protein [Planctomycetia bacterium]|nr:DUF933 domain-containing protein [Planctomycetia bacterium]
MKIGLVGYQGSGKSSLYQWLTGVEPDPAKSHQDQSAMAVIPEPRVDELVRIYTPKKVTRAAIEITDTPGLNRDHDGNAQKLACLREADSMVLVVAGFGGMDPKVEYQSFYEDLLLADMELVARRIERVCESLNRKALPKEEREHLTFELETLQKINDGLEAGVPIKRDSLDEQQQKILSSFSLFTQKSHMVLVNTADDEQDTDRFRGMLGAEITVLAAPVGLQLELTKLSPEEGDELVQEMGLKPVERDEVIRTMMDVSGQMLFFTAGEKEVRTWILRKHGTAVEAAGSIHTDLARGFIRAEIMQVKDIIRLGSEREVKAAGLVRQEPKDYVIQDGDCLFIKFSV